MLTLVIGGAASGKSAYAESLTLKHPLPRYYVATMQVWDEECAKRVEKHRAMRKEKQFETIESPIDLDVYKRQAFARAKPSIFRTATSSPCKARFHLTSTA